jgi:FlaA1/EpsC-like NDP-sugar epimerase
MPGWLVKSAVMAAVICASWLVLVWVMVTQDPAESSSRVIFVISVFITMFVTSLPLMHRIFSRFAPSRLQQGNPVLVIGHSFLLASFLVANLSLMLVGSWNVTMFILIAAITLVVESLFLARK